MPRKIPNSLTVLNTLPDIKNEILGRERERERIVAFRFSRKANQCNAKSPTNSLYVHAFAASGAWKVKFKPL